jgi:hypothetical protein
MRLWREGRGRWLWLLPACHRAHNVRGLLIGLGATLQDGRCLSGPTAPHSFGQRQGLARADETAAMHQEQDPTLGVSLATISGGTTRLGHAGGTVTPCAFTCRALRPLIEGAFIVLAGCKESSAGRAQRQKLDLQTLSPGPNTVATRPKHQIRKEGRKNNRRSSFKAGGQGPESVY